MFERRNRRADRSIILLVLILAVVAGAVTYAVLQLRVDQITDSLKKKQPLNTLFIVSEGDRALFFEVFFYNPQTRKGSLFYVPPNVGSVIATINRVEGIDALYRRSSPLPLRQKVEELLGAPLQGVIDLSVEDVGRLVDLVGGVDVFIPNPVDLTLADARILLPSGSVRLDGDKAREFVTYRDPLETEADAVGRRQKFLQALLKGMGENEAFLLQRGPMKMLRTLVRTDLPGRALSSFIAEMGRFDSERMVLQRVLGTTRSVDGRDLLFPHQDGELLKQAVKQAMAANASNEFVSPCSTAPTRRGSPGARAICSRATTSRSWRRTTRTTTSTRTPSCWTARATWTRRRRWRISSTARASSPSPTRSWTRRWT